MMKYWLGIAVVFFCGNAMADTISTVPGASFLNMPANYATVGGGGVLNGLLGSIFFANRSADAGTTLAAGGTNAATNPLGLNAGFFLSGTGAWAGNAASPNAGLSNLQYLGASSSSGPDQFFFNSSGATYRLTLLLALTGNALEFGWYNTATPGVLNPIFTTSTALGTQVAFTPSASYGFYIRYTTSNANTWGFGWKFFTQDNLNQTAANIYGVTGPENPTVPHFSLFQNTSIAGGNQRFYLAVEDGYFGNSTTPNFSDRDYNDFIVQLDVTGVPEPAVMGMVGAGLLALGAAARRRRRR